MSLGKNRLRSEYKMTSRYVFRQNDIVVMTVGKMICFVQLGFSMSRVTDKKSS
jgi:hypothetical protein